MSGTGTEGTGTKPAESNNGLVALIASLLEVVPGGKVLGKFLQAPTSTQKAAIQAFTTLALYPAYIFVVVMFFISVAPSFPKLWLQGLADSAFGFNKKIDDRAKQIIKSNQTDLDTNNHVIDGASLLQFEVSPASAGDSVYIEQVSVDKALNFLTYQNQSMYSTSANPICTQTSLESLVKGRNVGDLIVSAIGFVWGKQSPVSYSHGQLVSFMPFNKKTWDEIKDAARSPSGAIPPVINLRIEFQPNPALRSEAAACSKFEIFVIMNYTKMQAL